MTIHPRCQSRIEGLIESRVLTGLTGGGPPPTPVIPRELHGMRVSVLRVDAITKFGASGAMFLTRSPYGGFVFRSDSPGKWAKVGRIDNVMSTGIRDGGSGKVYAIAGDSGFYKSTDSGANWTKITTLSTATPVGVWALTYGLHVTAVGNVLVCDMNNTGGHIFRSTDNGATFSDLGAKATGGIYKFAEHAGVLLASTTDGEILKSTEQGLTWMTAATLSASPIWGLAAVGAGVWVCANEAREIYRSVDDGNNWTLIKTVGGGADAMEAVGNYLLLSTYTGDRALHASQDGGLTWTQQPAILGDSGDILSSMAVVSGHIVASTDDGWVFYTDPDIHLGLPVGAWTPALTTTQLWLDGADDDSVLATVGGAAGVATGSQVAQWTDKSGNGRHVVQADAAKRPVRQGTGSKYGLMRFSGHVLSAGPTGILRNTDEALIYIIRRASGASMTPGYAVDIRTNSGAVVRALMSVDTNTGLSASGGRRSDADTYAAASGSVAENLLSLNSQALAIDYAGAEARQYGNAVVDGQAIPFQTAGRTDDTDSGSIGIGAHPTGDFTQWKGDIAEVIIAHKLADRLLIEGYLHHKWGIAWLLPPGHLFKAAPPMAGDGPPVFTMQPRDESGELGGTETFNSKAAGTEPITYQWWEKK